MSLDAVAERFRWLYAATGLNFTIVYEPYNRGRFLAGLGMTIYPGIVTVAASLVIGAIGAWAQGARSPVVRSAVHGFVLVSATRRPWVFFFYFGVGALLPASYDEIGLRQPFLTNVQWAIVSLSLFAGAFNVEIFRSGIGAVPRTTVEAAESLGYGRLGVYRHVLLPLALRVCLPALNSNLINLLKTTTLAYAIAVPETLYVAKQIWSASQNVPEIMGVLLMTYLVLVGGLVWLMHRWERAVRITGYGR